MSKKSEKSLQIHSDLKKLSPEMEKHFSGRYYTPKKLALNLIETIVSQHKKRKTKTLSVIDPFAGDGRLVKWLIEAYEASISSDVNWNITLWDVNHDGLITAEKELKGSAFSDRIKLNVMAGDAFVNAARNAPLNYEDQFDFVITNPPWEVIKPDQRYLKKIPSFEERQQVVARLKCYDEFLKDNFPLSQPKTKFAGWGTDLSRVGLELCFNLSKSGGYVAIVLPNSFLADHKSSKIREHALSSTKLKNLTVYPAEARLFEGADVGAITCLFEKVAANSQSFELELFDSEASSLSVSKISLTKQKLEQRKGNTVKLGH